MFDKKTLENMKKAQEKWESGVLRESLEKQEERKSHFQTWSGLPVKRIYTPLDLEQRGLDFVTDIGFPGEFPFVRGIEPTMYRSKLWERIQYSGYGLPEDSNQRIKYLLEHGETGFYLALDLPTQMAYDADNPLAKGEVGKVGVSICSIDDIEKLLEGIPLDRVSQIRTTAMSTGPIMLAMFLAVAERKGVSPESFVVRLQNDVLKEYVARGTCIFPPEPSLNFATDVIEYCAKYLPGWSPLSFAGTHMRLAGATVVQELAFTLANAIAYIESTLNRGLSIDDFAPKIYSLISANTLEFFEEICKIRAIRKMWSYMLRDRYGAKNPESMKLRLNSFASGFCSTVQEPLNNIARIAIETLAIALGGAQDVGVSAYDEPLCTPSEEAARIALRTSQIVSYELGITNVVDPLGGSYYVETLTDELARQAWELLGKVDKMGGAVRAIESGYYQREILRSAYADMKRVESGDREIIGVNKFVSYEPARIRPFIIDGAMTKEIEQRTRLAKLRQDRDNQRVEETLNMVREAAEKGKNTIPSLVEAVKSRATIGEIGDTLRRVFGEWLPEKAAAMV